MNRRIITTELVEEDIKIENNLRPKLLKDYIGQTKAKETLKIILRLQSRERNRWTMYCFTGLRDWERQPWQGSLPMR